MSASQSLRAVVLASRAYGEADRIVTLLCAEHGKVAAFARGARRSQKRFGGALDGLMEIQVQVRPPRAGDGLWRLEQAEVINPRLALRTSLELLERAARLSETVSGIAAEGEGSAALFGLYLRALDLFAEAGASQPFHNGLLARGLLAYPHFFIQVGVLPEPGVCGACAGVTLENDAGYHLSRGFLCSSCSQRAGLPTEFPAPFLRALCDGKPASWQGYGENNPEKTLGFARHLEAWAARMADHHFR